jgi:hypothetical protein
MRVLMILLVVFGVIFTPRLMADEMKVIGVLTDGILVNRGAAEGVQPGMTGRIYYENEFQGKLHPIYIAIFKIIAVEKTQSKAQILQYNKKIEIDQKVIFNTPPSLPDPGKKPVEPVKEPEKPILSEPQKLPPGYLVEIQSQPDSALVIINGKKAGRTPLKNSMENGRYQIRLEKEGFAPCQDTIDVESLPVHRLFELKKSRPAAPTINFLTLEPQIANGYIERFLKIRAPLPKLDPVEAIQGSAVVVLSISDDGRVALQQTDFDQLDVTPGRLLDVVKRAIIAVFTNLRIDPPRDRDGQSVRLENWRLSYKVGLYQGAIILTKQ